uniref:Nardilysin n=1 Tax=Trichogramma kaykai TaxID=54128 RepID=A0ABD2WH48_9HYME
MSKPTVGRSRGTDSEDDDDRSIMSDGGDCPTIAADNKPDDDRPFEYLERPKKALCDRKNYRAIKLKNGLTALLVSTLDSDEDDEGEDRHRVDAPIDSATAACALCINVGNFSDPREVQGLAHFLEHVISMGSAKYPEENEWDRFIRGRCGSAHADTSRERTKFHFQIHSAHLRPALDRLANFFIEPRLTKDALMRERESVDNEFHMDLMSDGNRLNQLVRSAASTTSADRDATTMNPAAKFSCGNAATLRDGLDENSLCSWLRSFQQRHYSAQRMTLALQAPLTLDQLQEYVVDSFSDVPNNGLEADDFSSFRGMRAFDPSKLGKLYEIESVDGSSRLEIKWIMPPQTGEQCDGLRYVARLLSQEGPGSLSQHLRQRKLCHEYEVSHEQNSVYSLLGLSLGLRDDDNDDDDDDAVGRILEATFAYAALLRRLGPQRRIHDEMRAIAEYKFEYGDEREALVHVQRLSLNMQLHPGRPRDYVRGDELCGPYEPDRLRDFLELLSRPEACLIVRLRSGPLEERHRVEDLRLEPWYGFGYAVSEVPEAVLRGWRDPPESLVREFALPQANPYLVTDFRPIGGTISRGEDRPRRVSNSHGLDLWYKPDATHRRPTCSVYLHLGISTPLRSLRSYTRNAAPVRDIHPRDDAGRAVRREARWHLVRHFSQRVRHRHQSLRLQSKSTAAARRSREERRRFRQDHQRGRVRRRENRAGQVLLQLPLRSRCLCLVRAARVRNISSRRSSYLIDVPYFLSRSEIHSSLSGQSLWLSSEKRSALERTRFEHLVDFAKQLSRQVYVEALVQGNATPHDALATVLRSCGHLASRVFYRTPPGPDRYQPLRRRLPSNDRLFKTNNRNPLDVNSVVMNYYATSAIPPELSLSLVGEFLEMLLQEPLFNRIRRQEQLGYIVICTANPAGVIVTVYTPAYKYSTEYVDRRIDRFFRRFSRRMRDLTRAEFDVLRECYRRTRRIEPLNLEADADKSWYMIKNRVQQLQDGDDALRRFDFAAFRDWMVDYTSCIRKYKRLSVQVEGNFDESCSEDCDTLRIT